MLLMLMFLSLGLRVGGQLILPEFVEEEGRGLEVPVPEVEGGHALEGEPGEEQMPEGESAAEMRRMMQAMQAVGRPRRGQERVEMQTGVRQVFTGGPAEVRVRLRSGDGRVAGVVLPNQTLTVETRAGRLPVRLDALERMVRAGEGFVFWFRGGDRMEGALEAVYVQSAGEGLRRLPLAGVSEVRIDGGE